MKTVLIPPILKYETLTQLPQQIAHQFAKNGYLVYFCNQPAGVSCISRVSNNFYVYNNFYDLLGDIKRGKIKVDILYNTWAKNHEWVDIVKPKTTIYHSCDMFEEWKIYEYDMIRKSDIVLCTAKRIFDIRSKQHNNVHLVRNGCNEDMINANYITPEEMKVEGVKPLFCGASGKWVRTRLIRKVAEHYPNTFFVGSEFGRPIPNNVINLGLKSHNELINYYSVATYGLLPFDTQSEITLAANPIKLWEYLACGKPVLSTHWDETTLSEFKDVVLTANTDEEYVELAHLLADKSQEELDIIAIKAKEIAANNTWEKRFEQIKELI